MNNNEDNMQPPKLAQRFLHWFCSAELLEQIEGDLNEEFYQRTRAGQKTLARFYYFLGVLRFCQPFAWKKRQRTNNTGLLLNFIKIGYRNIIKYRSFSALNIVGLSLSMCLCLLIMLFVREKSAMDNFHTKRDSIYRVITHEQVSDRHLAYTPPNVATTLGRSYAGIEGAIQMVRSGYQFKYDKKELWYSGIFANEQFFNIFSFELLSGQGETALENKSSIVVSSELASEFFGNQNPLGNTIELSGFGEFTITGVVEADRHSHINFDFILPFNNISQEFIDSWQGALDLNSGFYYSYITVNEEADLAGIENALAQIASDFNLRNDEERLKFSLQAMSDIPLGDALDYEMSEFPPRFAVYFLSILALAVIAVACFNYVSLSTARAVKRAKEIGLRKISGAKRSTVVMQFLSESVMLAIFSLLISIGVLYYLIPGFNNLEIIKEVNAGISLDFVADYKVYLLFLGFSVVVGICAGLYPAFYLSSLKPIAIVGNSGQPSGRGKLRKILLTIQLAFSLIFILITTAQFKQYKHLLAFQYGFHNENIINLDLQGADYLQLKSALLQDPGVESVAAVSRLPGLAGARPHAELERDSIKVPFVGFSVDEDFIETLGLELVAGNDFSPNSGREIIINEGAAMSLGFDQPGFSVNSILKWNDEEVIVRGVVKNFHHGRIDRVLPESPVVIAYNPEKTQIVNVRISGGDVPGTIARLSEIWSLHNPNFDFEYEFYDLVLDQRYSVFRDLIKIFSFAAISAIFIACMGLLGMAAYNADLRVKEIGIRKVMGASVSGIFRLLNQGYLKLLAIAATFALPLGWIIATKLLDNFSNKVSVGFDILILAIALIMVPTMLATSSQTIRAAKANPANSLREE